MHRGRASIMLAVASVGLLAGAAQAASIGVQFTGFDGRNVLPTEYAGLVPQQNFNVISAYADANGVDYRDSVLGAVIGASHPFPSLMDNLGAVSGVTGTATGIWDMYVFGSAASPTPDQRLLSHSFGENGSAGGSQPVRTGTIALSNLNASGYTSYDLIVYVSLSTGSDDHPSTIALNGGAAVPIMLNGNSSYETPFTFVDATSGSPGNYVRYNGLTGDSVSFSVTSPPYYNGGGFAGFQIISVPEPASLGLIGLAGLSLIARRRKA